MSVLTLNADYRRLLAEHEVKRVDPTAFNGAKGKCIS